MKEYTVVFRLHGEHEPEIATVATAFAEAYPALAALGFTTPGPIFYPGGAETFAAPTWPEERGT